MSTSPVPGDAGVGLIADARAMCCPHPAVRSTAATGTVPPGPAGGIAHDMVRLVGGTFVMGSAEAPYPQDGESPARSVEVAPFRIGRYAVTNAEFAAFVDATGYGTTAEREGTSFVYAGQLPDTFGPTRGVVEAPWWRVVPGACWWRPEGPGSSLDGRGDHPVVHISWLDARAYTRWAGLRLPTEAEWEFAARGGLERCRYPWGDELEPGGRARMNVFCGSFPRPEPGSTPGPVPVDSFAPNGFGLFNTTGNVWEWCGDRWSGPPPARPAHRVMRGGSYLCHESYCYRYRCAARTSNGVDGSTGHIGFRVAGSS